MLAKLSGSLMTGKNMEIYNKKQTLKIICHFKYFERLRSRKLKNLKLHEKKKIDGVAGKKLAI